MFPRYPTVSSPLNMRKKLAPVWLGLGPVQQGESARGPAIKTAPGSEAWRSQMGLAPLSPSGEIGAVLFLFLQHQLVCRVVFAWPQTWQSKLEEIFDESRFWIALVGLGPRPGCRGDLDSESVE